MNKRIIDAGIVFSAYVMFFKGLGLKKLPLFLQGLFSFRNESFRTQASLVSLPMLTLKTSAFISNWLALLSNWLAFHA